MKSRRRRASGLLLEALEGRQLMSINMVPLHPTLYPDDRPAIATITGVRPLDATMSDLHAFVRYDSGQVMAVSLAWQVDQTINVVATHPPGAGVHAAFIAFWQSVPGSRAVKNVLTTHTTFTVTDFTAGGTTGTGYARQAFTGVVATFTDADLPSSISGQIGPINFTPSVDHDTEIIVMIHWGDGQDASYGRLTQNGDGTWSVTGSHAYAAAGTYSVHVTMTSDTREGGPPIIATPFAANAVRDVITTSPGIAVITGIDLSPVTVVDTVSTVTIARTTAANLGITAERGVSATFDLGRIGLDFAPADADGSSRLSLGIIRTATPDLQGITEYVVGIKWGDGTTSAAQLIANANGGWEVFATRAFTTLGFQPVEVDVVGAIGAHSETLPYNLATSFRTVIDVGVSTR